MVPEGFIFIISGLFIFICAWKDWDWFMNNKKAKFFNTVVGRGKMRYFYFILSIGMVVAGALITMGILKLK